MEKCVMIEFHSQIQIQIQIQRQKMNIYHANVCH